MLHTFLIKIYNLLFLDEDKEDVHDKHKKTMASITVVLFLVVVIMICKQIVKNIL